MFPDSLCLVTVRPWLSRISLSLMWKLQFLTDGDKQTMQDSRQERVL